MSLYKNFPSVTKYYSFEPNNDTQYELTELETNIINKFEQLIYKLEKIPQVTLCTRGDSKKNIDEHNKLFNENLSKLFIVGEKAQSNRTKQSNNIFKPITDKKESLCHELCYIIRCAYIEISNKPKLHKVRWRLYDFYTFLKNLPAYDYDTLTKWKIFFLSFLHNSGSLKEFKNTSPFLSMTYGYKKYSTARKFALNRVNHNKAIIYLYSLNNGDPYYIKTKLMNQELNRFNINWYKDIHNEIMLINGMYPHYLLGIFEVTKNSTPRFIMNPWLYKTLKDNDSFDYKNGLKINQQNFNELARDLGYSNFFFTDGDGNSYISDLNYNDINEVIRP